MSTEKEQRKRNTQIPPEAISDEGGDYPVEITFMQVNVLQRELENQYKNNSETVIPESGERKVEPTELQLGVKIAAKDGGIETAKRNNRGTEIGE